ncbi:DNA-3-methyladenine glycosylase II [Brevibacterium sanguinis]|uniref:DNA-3-methyladenine glycosylase II n=2 Tax=Brevibacterium TaxID=1696 RepID=A0A366IK30_9MICO|nr:MULTISPECIES: Ada metal-binding domain-containing protein [Brevibacterium]RBP64219.1 DNA-3-methyladenine glycosylase II [Brevibacterium sanguinis]RBP71489.1 DNA-3-methyladenine glycosylase II [Brevibacterium celere]
MLSSDQCYHAVASRDRRFDGMFFTAVRSTGIFCRPSCPARTPLRHNVDFYLTAAAAADAGFRACKRCRPDASPGSPEWDVRADVTGRAMRLIRDGLVDREGVAGLASALGYSTRQLGRVMHAELGAGPLAISRHERARTARTLIESTSLTMSEIAFAAGFSSIRQFNDTVREIYAATPGDLRRAATSSRRTGPTADRSACTRAGELVVRLAYRPPLDVERLFGYLESRAIDGIEEAGPRHCTRSLRLAHGPAVVSLRPGAGDWIDCGLRLSDTRDLSSAVARARRILDLDADPAAVASTLQAAGLSALAATAPGIRSPGHGDPVELAIRTVIGQQISVTAARTHLTRLVARTGEELPEQLRTGGVHRLFPTAEAIAAVPDEDWALPRRRITTIRGLASALADGTVDLGPGCDREEADRALTALPGIGPWTVGYIRMRALGDPDVFLGSDLGVRRALDRRHWEAGAQGTVPGAPIDDMIDACSPWRSYVTHLLWAQHARPMSSTREERR